MKVINLGGKMHIIKNILNFFIYLKILSLIGLEIIFIFIALSPVWGQSELGQRNSIILGSIFSILILLIYLTNRRKLNSISLVHIDGSGLYLDNLWDKNLLKFLISYKYFSLFVIFTTTIINLIYAVLYFIQRTYG